MDIMSRRISALTKTSLRAAAGMGAVLTTLLLAGCAGAELDNLQERGDAAPAAPLLVVVERPSTALSVRSAASPDAADPVATTLPVLSQVLVEALRKSGVGCRSAASGAADADAPSLRLAVDLEKVVVGNAFDRDVIGLGSGRSSIAAHVRLDDPRQASPQAVLAFDVRSSSGSMPGLLLSAGPIGLAIKGTGTLVSETSGDGHREADRAAAAIAKRVVAYYRAQGWLPPDKAAAPS